jgi:hypothetical protein
MRLIARRECLQTELLELELERRRALVGSSQAAPLELQPMPFELPIAIGPALEHKLIA